MRKTLSATVIAVLAIMAPLGQTARANGPDFAHFTGLWAFGDSLTDTGNSFGLSGGSVPASPPYFDGRFSNGPVWIESFGPLVDPNFETSPYPYIGSNFAFGGATTGEDIVNDAGEVAGFGLLGQVDLFPGGEMDNHDLAVIWAGPNDYFFLLDSGNAQEVVATAVGNIAAAVSELATAGGIHHFLVLNLPPLGDTPLFVGTPVSVVFDGLVEAHNTALAATMGDLEDYSAIFDPHFSLQVIDIATGFGDILAHPESYGLAVTTQACLPPDFADLVCAFDPTTGSFDGSSVLFWDLVHPTAAAHELISAYVAAAVAANAALPDEVANRDALVTTIALGQLRAAGAASAARP